MDAPLTVWYCDVCGKAIKNIDKVLLIWQQDEASNNYDFKFVHKTTNEKSGCDMEGYLNNEALSYFLGEDGMARLLSFLSYGKAIGGNGNSITDLDEFVDVIRRIHTPYYEEARRYFNTKSTQRLIGENSGYCSYTQKMLKQIIEINEKIVF